MLAAIAISLVVGFVIGVIVTRKFWGTANAFTQKEIMLITQKIESLRDTDLAKYNTLKSEWMSVLANKENKIATLSAKLEQIIKEVEAL